MSSSRAKNFRRRSDTDDAAGYDKPIPSSTTSTATKPHSLNLASKPAPASSPAPAPKPKPPDGGRLNRLSFAEDEDPDDSGPALPRSRRTASARPPSAGSIHKLSSSRNRAAPSVGPPLPSIPSNVQPQAGEYTKERLLELQKNARCRDHTCK